MSMSASAGLHRYAVVLLEQPGQIQFESIGTSQFEQRLKFDVRKFIRKCGACLQNFGLRHCRFMPLVALHMCCRYDLKPRGVNWFMSQHDSAAAALRAQIGLD